MALFSTPDLYDNFSDQVQVADAGLLHYGGKTHLYGQAVIVQCPNDNSQVGKYLKSDGKGKVLVVNANNSKQFAFLGDILAKSALQNQWHGVIINGCVRDVEILQTLPLPIMALGATPRKTHKQGLGEKLSATSFLSITIEQNNWLYGDLNGLLVSKHRLVDIP